MLDGTMVQCTMHNVQCTMVEQAQSWTTKKSATVLNHDGTAMQFWMGTMQSRTMQCNAMWMGTMQSRTMQQRLSKGGCGTHCWIVLTRRADNRNTRPASPNQEFQTLATQIVITGDNSNGTHDSFDMTVAPIPVRHQGTPCKPGNGFLICPDLLQ